jgi:hypothetical protein
VIAAGERTSRQPDGCEIAEADTGGGAAASLTSQSDVTVEGAFKQQD